MAAATRESIEGKVRSSLSDMLGLASDEIKLDSHILEDLGADSLDIVELIMEAEEEFELELPDHEMERCFTVEQVIDLIASKVL